MEIEKGKHEEKKKCFVMMPIADTEGYEIGHFNRVYEYIIKPAIVIAGFEPMRADEVNKANFIIIDILKQIVSSDIAICDLSSRNPNVLYELGIRQAFNLPVCLLKDNKTTRMFDIQGFRDVEYDEKLRIDNVQKTVEQLAKNIMNTYESKGDDINSIIQLMGIKAAEIETTTEISNDTSIVLDAINNLNNKMFKIENGLNLVGSEKLRKLIKESSDYDDQMTGNKESNIYKIGSRVNHAKFGNGNVIDVKGLLLTIEFENMGTKKIVYSKAPLKLIEEKA